MKTSFKISHNKENYTNPINFHSHDFYEIYFFVDGNVTYYIENESYSLSKGDVIVIPPGKLHRPVIEENVTYDRYVLWLYNGYVFRTKAILRFVEEINYLIDEKNTRLISFIDSDFRMLKDLFDRLLNEFSSNDELSKYSAESCNVLVLGEILRKFKQTERVCKESNDIVKQVISYINAHVVNAPSLEELSAEFFVSKYYLSHKFKEYTKTTVHQYILMKKVNLAKELLEKGNPPKEVCSLCGFSTYSNFYKVFTK
ncbi:MAG: helix-turn-helix domain-containing protein [Oscillospiraceae bacterium]